MTAFIPKKVTSSLTARHCEGCHLFASCEEIRFVKGSLWLCGNCRHFVKLAANMIIRKGLGSGQVQTVLRQYKNSGGFSLLKKGVVNHGTSADIGKES